MILPKLNISSVYSENIDYLALASDVLINVPENNSQSTKDVIQSIISQLTKFASYIATRPNFETFLLQLPASISEISDFTPLLDVIIKALDFGVTRVVFSLSSTSNNTNILNNIKQIPSSRIAINLSGSIVEITSLIDSLLGSGAESFSQLFVSPVEKDVSISELSIISKKISKAVTSNLALFSFEPVTLDRIKLLDIAHIDLVVDSSSIYIPTDISTNFDPPTIPDGLLGYGEAIAACLTTDRQDGLFASLVVDEHNVALGLVYSSVKSISESCRTRTGVYQSRTRGFCHLNTRTCFGKDNGITGLYDLLAARKISAPTGSYTSRLFNDPKLLRSKIMEEADELCDAETNEDIAWEAADLIYFALVKCVGAGVSLADIERQLDSKNKKVTRRPGNAKPKWAGEQALTPTDVSTNIDAAKSTSMNDFSLVSYNLSEVSPEKRKQLLQRPIMNTDVIMSRVKPIVKEVREHGDAGILKCTERFDGVKLSSPVIKAPFDSSLMQISPEVKAAIDVAFDNIYKFHEAQLDKSTLSVETMPGVICERFSRPIQKVGIYVPGGTAILPSTALMLGIPALVAGCEEIVLATPPTKTGTACPEVVYVAHKVGVSTILLAGGAQAVVAMAYGTESVPKVDKICGPGNQYVTAAKMMVQNDTSALVAIDMPAGPSEVLVIADSSSNPEYVASDLLSQAEHGVDSQVVLITVGISPSGIAAIEKQLKIQGELLPRRDIARVAIGNSFVVESQTVDEAIQFSNDWAPEHLILHLDNAESVVMKVKNAGSVFVGEWSPESCGDYASGTNHTLPTYGFARNYSGVNTNTFLKHITSQKLSKEGLDKLGDTVATLAAVEGLEAHRNAVLVRLKDIRI
ncbi:trifunctional histidinol dehydrogenase [Nowakowskiella sp. JEL0078]|nr:trifunctional histidinol dehydrogenase [Nowakowskiella sp. JEL0078]